MTSIKHLTLAEMEAGLEIIRQAPKDNGVLKLISRRPDTDDREVLAEAQLDPAHGLLGDNWKARGSRSTPDGLANPEMQLNVMKTPASSNCSRRTNPAGRWLGINCSWTSI